MKKILVIRFSSIGDIVLTSPVLRCLKEQTGSEIHFITKEPFRAIVANNPHVSQVITIKRKVAEAREQLLGGNYDFVVDLHHNLRSMQVKRLLGKPSGSFPKLNVEKWLLVNARINRMPDKHIVDRYFEAVQELGVKNDGNGLDYFIPAGDEMDRSALPETHRDGFVAIAVGAKFATKQIPEELLEKVILRLRKPVVLLGGKEDTERAARIAAACGKLVFDTTGKLSLNQSASLVRQSQMLITGDTGLMHIAAAFKKKIYSVWGNTVPQFGMFPYLPGEGSRIIEIKGLPCRPCSKIGYDRCPKGNFRCMKDIRTEDFFREESSTK